VVGSISKVIVRVMGGEMLSYCTDGAQAWPTVVRGSMIDQVALVVFPMSKLTADIASTGSEESCQHSRTE